MKSQFAIALALALLLGATPHAYAKKGGGVRSAAIGKTASEPARTVRDHRGPGGVKGGGVSVKRACTPRNSRPGHGGYPHCHSH